MTQKLNPTQLPMELDIDSFLDSPLSSDSDDDSNFVPHRTVDEILNQSDSSALSSPPPSPPSSSLRYVRPPPQFDAVEQEPAESVRAPQSDSKSEGFPRAADPIWRSRSSSSSAAPRQLPTLFGGVRSNAKPGAALAAAAAASRSVLTPHAAALKSRRAGSGVPRNGVDGGEIGSSSGGENVEVCSSNGDSVGLNSERSDSLGKLDVDDYNKIAVHSAEGEVNLSRQSEDERDEIVHDRSKESQWRESECTDGKSISNDDSLLSNTALVVNLNVEQVNGSTNFDSKQTVNDMAAISLADEVIDNEITALLVDRNSRFSSVNEVDKKSADYSAGVDWGRILEEEVTSLDLEDEKGMQTTSDVEQGGENDDDASSTSEISELVEERIEQLESEIMNKKAENDIQAPKKPLELAEELEKKLASTGVHLEEGAAAQPMRLEGVRRGSTTIGYFEVDAHKIVTGTISSQAFRRDHGSPQVLAVHSNFIAVGMSKGTISLVPSKYSPQHADNMDSKVLMLGVQGDRSLSPVTSMCFNQQGDLLLAGYADGHITVWDVQRTSIAKSIAGEHSAPVVHTFFLGQDSQASRQFKAVTGDNKGLVQLHTFSVFPLLNRFTIKTQCLLDGQRTSTVLSASPLLFDDSSGANVSAQGNSAVSMTEEGVVVFATHQNALVVRLSPNLEIYAQLSRPEGVREGSMPYTAWKCVSHSFDSSENTATEAADRISLLVLAWDRKIQVVKLVKSELKLCAKWSLDSSAVGVTWLDDQMLVVLTVTGQLYLFTRDGTLIHQTSFVVDGFGDDFIAYNTHFVNIFGNPEKSYHNCISVRGASVYILGPMHLAVSRLLPWKERIQVMQKAGDWMGALSMAMTLYDGRAPGVIGLPRNPDAVRDVIMPYLVELLLSYVDEVFSYISVAFNNQIGKAEQLDNQTSRTNSVHTEIKEQFTRVGGVAVEFCVHIKWTDILFDEIFSRFVAVQHRDTFLELLEPYVLKDMLGSLPPEIMQALVEHYSSRGWLQRVEQCVLHMDISSLDFNQVARLCREHGLYSALIYIFNKGLDDFRAPLEELLAVLRNSGGETAHALGYRMLVYLKYCFIGLAFPPGQGSLPPSRLPSLRAELLQFLLEVSDRWNAKPTTTLSFGGQYLNLYYILELDTEATLDVLRCAFAEADAPKLDCPVPDSSDTSGEPAKQSDLVTVSQNMLLQNTVDVLVHIVEDVSHMDRSVTRAENKLLEAWPSTKDIAHIFEFIAYYVSCGRANISKTVLNQILQYLTSERNPAQTITTHSESSKRKEKQLLALLSIVPGTDWDQMYVLQMCDSAQFFQVCGFIHAIRQQYIAALDSYVKEIDEPVHAFSFINDMLLRLTGDEAAVFRSAVLSRIPELVNLSREGTFLLVLDHFNPEGQLILAELQAHPKSLFLYLKTAIEVHLSGTLNLSDLSVNEPAYASTGRKLKDQWTVIEAYLGRVSELPKWLRSNPLPVTDDMIEHYLELLCQFERDSVLKFLETFDSYRVEHCLRLCQEYGITDAAAFLMERVGDVGSALLLTLAELDDKFMKLDAAVSSAVSHSSLKKSASMQHLNTVMKMKEVNDIYGLLHACIGLCQRNTPRLNPEESEILWFRLLDSFCEPLMGSYSDDARASDVKGHVGGPVKLLDPKDGKETSTVHWKISKSHRAAHILRKLFSRFIKEIVEGMIGYVHLPTVMSKLLSDNGSQEFGDFKLTILGMLGTYGFERRILDTAKSLIEDDTFYTMSLLRKGASHAYAPRSLVCCICNSSLTKNSSGFRVRVFSCGHATHLQCENLENESSIRGPSSGCPICLPKKSIQRSRNKSAQTEKGLVSTLPSKDLRAQGSLHPHESDVLDNSYGLQQISRFEILSNLQKGQRLAQTESMPQLRLAPPAIYHEKVKKGMDLLVGESSRQLSATEKLRKSRQLRDLRVKGSALRFPLKSSIFGKEKTSIR